MQLFHQFPDPLRHDACGLLPSLFCLQPVLAFRFLASLRRQPALPLLLGDARHLGQVHDGPACLKVVPLPLSPLPVQVQLSSTSL